MTLKLQTGFSQKVGQPNYGSLGATCQLTLEFDPQLLAGDPDGFQERVRQAFQVCQQAVQHELERQLATDDAATHLAAGSHPKEPQSRAPGEHELTAGPVPRPDCDRPATAGQVRALEALAARHEVDLLEILQNDFGYTQPGELSAQEASQLIAELTSFDNDQAPE